MGRLRHERRELRGELGQRLDLCAQPLRRARVPRELHDPVAVDLVGVDRPPGADRADVPRAEFREHGLDARVRIGAGAHTVGPVSGSVTGTTSSTSSDRPSRSAGVFSANHATTAALAASADADA